MRQNRQTDRQTNNLCEDNKHYRKVPERQMRLRVRKKSKLYSIASNKMIQEIEISIKNNHGTEE